MNRRSFLKTLCAVAGIAVVPSLGTALPRIAEPVKWIVEEFDCGYSFGVGASWPNGVHHAVAMMGYGHTSGKEREKSIAYCKQALRQWYLEKHTLKKAA